MAHGGEASGLALEALCRRPRQPRAHEFERHLAAQGLLHGDKHIAHAARTEFTLQPVAASDNSTDAFGRRRGTHTRW